MTENEFIAELEQLPREQYPFQVAAPGKIRIGRSCHCPITALLQHKTGKSYSPLFYLEAGELLSLGRRTARRIGLATDNVCGTPSLLTLRSRLLSALGLQGVV